MATTSVRRPAALLAAALAVVVAAGCGDDGKLPRAPVSGRVTYKGKPVVGAAVSFLPDTVGWRAGVGKTDEQGRYLLGTYDPDDGAPVGKCRVALSLRGPGKPLKPGLGAAAAEELMEMGDPLIPIRYFDPDKSGLTFTVEKGKDNVYDIDLRD
ncbi:MAG TPA: hypothetical protein VM597_01490 [Gemmataceae bacterium]|nr:hypothetical protein [Gemmataceae bacterium]